MRTRACGTHRACGAVAIYGVVLALRMSCAATVCLTASLQAASDAVEPEPLHCWWRTSVSAVRIGESFSAVLTCATVETSALSVVVDRSTLEPVVAALPPFEVMGGKRSPDLLTGERRFFQYEYNLRLISDELFDRDVTLPDLPITYKVRTTEAGQAAAVEGPDQRYALPPIAVRILSLVPDTERDIRDTTMGTFSSLDEARSRADVLVTVGLVISALGAGLAVLGMTTLLIERRRGPRARRGSMLSDVTVVRAVRRELASIRRERASSGWTPALIGRALAALRVLAAYALGRPVMQRRVDKPVTTYDGGVALLGWGERRPRIVASGAVTTESVASALGSASANVGSLRDPTNQGWSGGPPQRTALADKPAADLTEVGSLREPTSRHWFGGPPRRTALADTRAGRLEAIHAALQAFTESQYGTGDIATDGRLDEGLAVADRLGTRLAVERSMLGRIARQAAHLRPRSWSR